MSARRHKPTIHNNLTIIRVWNSNALNRLAPIPIKLHQSIFRLYFTGPIPQHKGANDFAFFCRYIGGRNDKPTMPNSLTIIGVWNRNVLWLSAIIVFPLCCFFANPPPTLLTGCQQFWMFCRSMSCLPASTPMLASLILSPLFCCRYANPPSTPQ